ncbi:DNA-binding Xre family transcriptional regulator [Pedobacter cryoconitis]|uniref:hypothetical protein n=1 Tax=Pedobacter cryoconitis TaxID=188932 RepID=UPI001608E701|nr:hypothetical protein [Pedobacter cryoconitis]MBB6274923.1 DNA-binding Xre family transcriptional regulator [Pedobacter cryoconitis]
MKVPDSLSQSGTFTDKVMTGLKMALKKLAEEAALKDESLIIGDQDGNAKSVPAKDLLKTLSE